MSLRAGQKLNHYEIVEPIGKGGMGEVYRARDTKLDRDVAIKILPEAFARDKGRLERFQREARLLAQLNHENIATIHGLEEHDGHQFLIMELVGGETLAKRIANGPLSIDEGLELFLQIADGLEAAHAKGILHRDLKPANIKVAEDGKPKILDFGLAKLVEAEADRSAEGSSQSPTLTKGTGLGVILGTAAYMSPEQARGKPVDKRMDVWAYGCCLYEALTGRRAFDGDNVTDVLAAVVNQEPDLALLPRQLPPAVSKLIRRCLMKDPRQRVPDVGMARLEIAEVLSAPAEAIESPPQTGPRLSAPIFATAILVVAVVAALSALAGHLIRWLDHLLRWRRGRGAAHLSSPDRPSRRRSDTGYRGRGFRLSRTGWRMARLLRHGELQKMRPDGDARVAFHRGRVLAAAWSVDDTVVFTDGADLWTIDTVGGEPKRVTTEGRYYGQPSFVPGAVLTSEQHWKGHRCHPSGHGRSGGLDERHGTSLRAQRAHRLSARTIALGHSLRRR